MEGLNQKRVTDNVKGNQEMEEHEDQEALAFGGEDVINYLGEGSFSVMHWIEAKLQGIKRGTGGEKIKTVKIGSILQEFGGEE